MNTVEAVANRIEQFCKERRITINGLSYISGVPNSPIKGIFYERSKKHGYNQYPISKNSVTDLGSHSGSFSAPLNLTRWSRRSSDIFNE